VYLGELEKNERKGWANLSRTLDGKQLQALQPELFGEEPQAQPVPENVKVNIRGVRVEKTTDFGDVWLALLLWRTLGLGELFKDILPERPRGCGVEPHGGDTRDCAVLPAV
jgi:hypothetical protein